MKPTDDLGTWAAAYREARRPSADLRARIATAVEEDGEATGPRQDRWRTWAIALGGGGVLAVAALLLLSWIVRWVGPEVVGSRAPHSAPLQHAPADAASTVVRDDASAASLPVPAIGVVEPTPIAVPPTSGDAAAIERPSSPVPTRRDVPPTTDDVIPPIGTGDDLESLRRLRAAEQVLRSDPAGARAMLEAHARDYPDSTLDLEREALWLRAACRSGTTANLERRRTAFAERAGVGVYTGAVERDCGR